MARLKRLAYKKKGSKELMVAYGQSARGSRFVLGSMEYSLYGLTPEEKVSVRSDALDKILAKQHKTPA